MKKPNLEFNSHECGILIHDRMHSHPYWQVEYIADGRGVSIYGTQQKYSLLSQCFVLIPPFTEHHFERIHPANDVYSFKFSLEEARPPEIRIVHPSDFTDACARTITDLARQNTTGRTRLLEYLLGALIDYAWSDLSPARPAEADLFESLRDLVQTDRRDINVESAAERLGLTVSQLKYQFRCCPQSTGTSVKAFIDKELSDLAERYLEYSSLPTSAIARELRFPNLYSFSHFFRRISGHSPGRNRPGKHPPHFPAS